jgi:ABC-type glycerol-3-phosphate transport system substrate-binding protein
MKLWILNDYNYSKYLYFKNISDEFLKEKNIKIDIEIKTRESVWESIFSFNGNNEKIADVFEVPHQWVGLLKRLGLILSTDLLYDLNSFSFFSFLKKTIYPDFSSKSFSLPLYFEAVSLFYIKNDIKKYITPSEMKDIKWNDFIILCEKLKNSSRVKDYYPLDNTNICGYITSDDVLCSVLNRNDGYFSDDGTVLEFHKDEVLSAIKDYIDLSQKKYLPLFEENFFEREFIKKKLSNMAFSFRRDLVDSEMDFTRFPEVIKRNYELIRSFNLVFSSSTEEFSEIKIFIEWFYKPENIVNLAKVMKVFSPFKDDLSKYLSTKEMEHYGDIFSKGWLCDSTVVYPTFEKMFNEFLYKKCLDIVNERIDYSDFKKDLMEIKALVEYLVVSY